MTRTVLLEQFPEGLSFPTELQHRIRYDNQARKLSFDGFMSKTDFDRLARQHDDIAYQRALERLFQICTIDPPSTAHTGGFGRWYVVGGALMTGITIAAVWLLR